MPVAHLGAKRLTYLVTLSALALLPGLGSASRLTYHEAFVAQGAREILILATGGIQRSVAYHGWRNLPCHGGWWLPWAVAPVG